MPKSQRSMARKLSVSVIEGAVIHVEAWSRVHRFGYRWRVEGALLTVKRYSENMFQQGSL
ncbi:MAG: hypothetical protein QW514_07135 [Thermoprotei archaeon]